MKNLILRILISAILFSLIAGVVVLIIGMVLGWKTYAQFSDGLFWAGAIVLSIGGINALGRIYQPNDSRMLFSQSAVHMDWAERYKILAADVLHGNHLLAFLCISGLLLFGLSYLAVLIGRQF